jgi:hypothetical protein
MRMSFIRHENRIMDCLSEKTVAKVSPMKDIKVYLPVRAAELGCVNRHCVSSINTNLRKYPWNSGNENISK